MQWRGTAYTPLRCVSAAPHRDVRAMKTQTITTRTGESLTLYQADDGRWCCPACGSAELDQPAYLEDGGASFQMCSCGFEFGFDDDPGASVQALPTVTENLERWRLGLIEKHRNSAAQFAGLRAQLEAIGVANV